MAINSVVLTGRLTAAPDLQKTGSGFPFVNFCIAVDRQYKRGEEKEVDFVDCVAWRGTAEFLHKWFSKGDPIGIKGRIQVRSYESGDGGRRKRVEVVADEVSFIAPRASDKRPVSTAHAIAEATYSAGPSGSEYTDGDERDEYGDDYWAKFMDPDDDGAPNN